LVPMTHQNQNLVIAVLADLLAFAAVWQIWCIGVNQKSLLAGQDISFAVISFVAQQDADALVAGQVCSSLFFQTSLMLDALVSLEVKAITPYSRHYQPVAAFLAHAPYAHAFPNVLVNYCS